MSHIGQEGDTRKYRRLKKTDYYEAKSAIEAEKRQSKDWPVCRTCGQKILGATFGSPPDELYCLRCWAEKSSS